MLTFAPFPIQTLRITIRAKQKLAMEHFPGSQLRGNFDDALRRQECRSEGNGCSTCRSRPACAYYSLFNENFPHLPDAGKMKEYPRPYVIRPTPVPPEGISPGDTCSFELTLIGTANNHAVSVVKAFIAGGKAGIGKTRGEYELQAVSVINDDKEKLVYQPGRMSMIPPPVDVWPNQKMADYNEVVISFMTPISFRSKEQIIKEPPPFALLFKFLVTRVCRLAMAYCPQPGMFSKHGVECPFKEVTSLKCANAQTCREMLTLAEQVEVVDAEIVVPRNIFSNSSRTVSCYKPKGVAGGVTYQGNLSPFMPLLLLGERIQIGKNITKGFGKYLLNW